ncbi:hypothetical protein HID58_055677, partial [Brassica napus]
YIDEDIGTQGLEGLSQSSYVPDFDPSQTIRTTLRDWWTPMITVRKLPKVEPMEETAAPSPTKWERWCKGPSKKLELSDSPIADDGSPQSLLYYFNEESWNRFTQWALNPTPLRIGPIVFNLTVAQRIVTRGNWLGNEEMDVMMYMWRENTTLRRWNRKRVAFMSALFASSSRMHTANFLLTKKPTNCPIFFLLTAEESFRLMAELIKYGVSILIVYTFLRLARITKQRGIPTRCNRGEAASLFTSKTVKIQDDYFFLVQWDLRRLVYKIHLFKWTDKSIIEEIEDFHELVDVLLIDNSQFQNSMAACETMLKRQESRIEEIELRFIKALFVFCLVMVFMYLTYA